MTGLAKPVFPFLICPGLLFAVIVQGKRRPLQVRIEIRYEWRSAMEKRSRPVGRGGTGFSRTLPSDCFPAMPGHLSPCTIICLLSCNRVFFRSGGSLPVSFVSVSVFRQARCPSCNGRRSVADGTFPPVCPEGGTMCQCSGKLPDFRTFLGQ